MVGRIERLVAHPVALMLVGCAVSALGRAAISPVAVVAGLALLVGGTRRASLRQIWLVGAPAIWLSVFLVYQGAAEELAGGHPAFAAMMAVAALAGVAGLLLDRALVPRLGPVAASLVLPSVRIPLEVLGALGGPYGAWGSIASTAAGLVWLSPAVWLGGMFALSFLLTWLASAFALAVERGGLVLASPAAALALVAVAGMVMPHTEPSVRAAAVALPHDATGRSAGYAALVARYRAGVETGGALEAQNRADLDVALAMVARAADDGARVVSLAETNLHVLAGGEASVEAAMGGLARARGLWVSLGLAVIHRREVPFYENTIVLFSPDGTVASRYRKSHPIGQETTDMVRGDGVVPVAAAPFGRLAGIICFDSDFLGFVRGISRQGVDILLAPSNDWASIATMRAAVTRFRAVEAGATLVRPTSHGVSEIVAPDGRLLGVAPYDAERGTILVADVPARGAATPYARLGDWPAPTSLLLLGGLVWRSRRTYAPPAPRGRTVAS